MAPEFGIAPEETDMQMNLEYNMSKLTMFGTLAAIIAFIVLVIQAILEIAGSEEKEYDLDFACQLIDAPIITMVLINLLNSSGVPLVILTSLAYAQSKILQNSCLIKNVQTFEKAAYCSEYLCDKTGHLT